MDSVAKLIGAETHFTVVQLPQRRFPGVVLQGDSLHSMIQCIRSIRTNFAAGDVDEMVAGLDILENQLTSAQTQYEKTCSENNISLPYRQK
jgi:hypothetical protein